MRRTKPLPKEAAGPRESENVAESGSHGNREAQGEGPKEGEG